jgi:hypothetical protein
VGSGPKGSVSVGSVAEVSVGSVDSVVGGRVVDGMVSGPRFLEHETSETVMVRIRISDTILNLIIKKHLKKLNFRISNCISYFSK